MKNKQPFKLSDETITEFDISEVVYENGQESIEVLLRVKRYSDIVLTKQDLQNLLSEIEKCEDNADYLFDIYVNE